MNWYSKDAVRTLYAQGDLIGPSAGKRKVVRGGSWDEDKHKLRSSNRNAKLPFGGTTIYGSIGFRCVYDVSQ